VVLYKKHAVPEGPGAGYGDAVKQIKEERVQTRVGGRVEGDLEIKK
jgi:hypothetical protein